MEEYQPPPSPLGKSGRGKRKLVEIGAFVYDRIIERGFGVNIIPIDSLEKQQVLTLIEALVKYTVKQQKQQQQQQQEE